jgi:sporulation protein YlmC with PRC-barrel domain
MNTQAMDMHGLAVHDIDGTKIGDVIDFYFDAKSNEPQWLAVEGGVLGHRVVLVPVDDITREDDALKTPYPKEMIMDSPHVEGASIDKKSENALYEYYHVRRELPERTTKRAAHEQDRSKTGDARLRSWKAWKAA